MMKRVRSQAAREATIRTFSRRALLLRDAEMYRETLQSIVDVYDMRSELFMSDEELAASLYDRARLALQSRRSDAMEPEDVRFTRDLAWVLDAILVAYNRGLLDASREDSDAKP